MRRRGTGLEQRRATRHLSRKFAGMSISSVGSGAGGRKWVMRPPMQGTCACGGVPDPRAFVVRVGRIRTEWHWLGMYRRRAERRFGRVFGRTAGRDGETRGAATATDPSLTVASRRGETRVWLTQLIGEKPGGASAREDAHAPVRLFAARPRNQVVALGNLVLHAPDI